MTRASDAVSGGFAAIVGNIYSQGVEQSLPWIIAMFAVIMTDLVTGVRCAWLTGKQLRWSKGLRCTMSKMVSYLAFVVAFVMVGVASGYMNIPKFACLAVCVVEGFSIADNILTPHHINISFENLMKALGKKIKVEELDKIVEKEEKTKDNE